MKRSQGRKKNGPKNFRTRYFCLTNRELRYAKKKGDSPLCTIPFQELLAVERVDDETFGGMKFVSAKKIHILKFLIINLYIAHDGFYQNIMRQLIFDLCLIRTNMITFLSFSI